MKYESMNKKIENQILGNLDAMWMRMWIAL